MQLSSWWWRRQGLDGSAVGLSAAEVLSRTGWARSVGGAGPYLSLYARAGLIRPGLDQAVASLALHELPSARGCTYVVPATDFALALECARGSGPGEMATAQKLGVTTREVEQLETAVQQALKGGPLDPAALTEACGSKVRQLGDAGKKKGLNSTLPVALGRLQTEGVIRRVPVNGRLDNQRYRYTLWNLPLPTRPAEEAFVELARKYFQWTGPATLAEFQWFSGLGVKKAQNAIAPLGLVQMPGERWIYPADREAVEAKAKPDQRVALLSSLDALFLLRRNITAYLDPQDAARQIRGEKQLYQLGGITDLMFNAIMRGGRLIGLWEYEPETERIVWMSLVKKDQAIEQAVAATGEMIRGELGDARSFSLDSPKSRQPRIAWLRAQ